MLKVNNNEELVTKLVQDSKTNEFYSEMAKYIFYLKEKIRNKVIREDYEIIINLHSKSGMVIDSYNRRYDYGFKNPFSHQYFNNSIFSLKVNFKRFKDSGILFSGDEKEVKQFLNKALAPKIKKACHQFYSDVLEERNKVPVYGFISDRQFVNTFLIESVRYGDEKHRYDYLDDSQKTLILDTLPKVLEENPGIKLSPYKVCTILKLAPEERFVEIAQFFRKHNLYQTEVY